MAYVPLRCTMHPLSKTSHHLLQLIEHKGTGTQGYRYGSVRTTSAASTLTKIPDDALAHARVSCDKERAYHARDLAQDTCNAANDGGTQPITLHAFRRLEAVAKECAEIEGTSAKEAQTAWVRFKIRNSTNIDLSLDGVTLPTVLDLDQTTPPSRANQGWSTGKLYNYLLKHTRFNSNL